MKNTDIQSLDSERALSQEVPKEPESSRETIMEFPQHFADGVLGTTTQYRQLNNATAGKRQKTMVLIQTAGPLIIEALGGVKMLSSSTVKKTMDEIGHPLPFQGANALGDVLGRKGFNLPFAFSHGKRRYALHHVNSSEEEKVQFQNWIDSLNKTEHAKLIVA